MTEISDIEGVGPAYAETLTSAGYDSAEAIADENSDELDGLIDTVSGGVLKERAEEAAELEETVDSDEETEETESDTDDGPFTLEPDFSVDQENYLMYALLNESTQARRRSNGDRFEAAQEAIEDVKSGEPYEFTREQLNIAYTATNQLESEHRQTRGLSDLTGEMREMVTYFKEKRQEHWPDN